MTASTLPAEGTFSSAARLDVIRYSQVWEDHRVLERGLGDGLRGDVLSVASAGCNVLALLLAEPRSITALDVSPAQTVLVELKLAALKRLSHAQFAALLGATPHGGRADLYSLVRPGLTLPTRDFWDAHRGQLERGLLGAGMLERYLGGFRERHIKRLLDRAAIERLIDLDDREQQAVLFDRHFATREFRAAVREWFTASAMSGRARDRRQFRHVETQDVAGHFLGRLRHVFTALSTRGNFYLEWLLTGRYRDLAIAPPYLRPENYDRLRQLVDRVEVVDGELGSYLDAQPPGSFDAVNASDVFEYLSEDATAELLGLLSSRLRPGGRVAYWNLLVERSLRGSRVGRLTALREQSRALWRDDRVFFYRDFHIDEEDPS